MRRVDAGVDDGDGHTGADRARPHRAEGRLGDRPLLTAVRVVRRRAHRDRSIGLDADQIRPAGRVGRDGGGFTGGVDVVGLDARSVGRVLDGHERNRVGGSRRFGAVGGGRPGRRSRAGEGRSSAGRNGRGGGGGTSGSGTHRRDAGERSRGAGRCGHGSADAGDAGRTDDRQDRGDRHGGGAATRGCRESVDRHPASPLVVRDSAHRPVHRCYRRPPD